MLTCEQNSQLISAQYDRELGFRERMGMRMHLLLCKYCKLAARQIALIQRLVGMKVADDISADSPARLSPQARERIEESIRNASEEPPRS